MKIKKFLPATTISCVTDSYEPKKFKKTFKKSLKNPSTTPRQAARRAVPSWRVHMGFPGYRVSSCFERVA
ncbi:MAG: hypothetical protein ACYS1A_11970, partial [Planctomycetota bacterium]